MPPLPLRNLLSCRADGDSHTPCSFRKEDRASFAVSNLRLRDWARPLCTAGPDMPLKAGILGSLKAFTEPERFPKHINVEKILKVSCCGVPKYTLLIQVH